MPTDMEQFAGFLALAYHEARNVRHLVARGRVQKEPFRMLVDGLPNNREAAWKVIQHERCEAERCRSARDAEAVFRKRFQLSLEDLASLSEHEGWEDSAYGGNAWAKIDRAVAALRDAIDAGNGELASALLQEMPAMRHNTGRVGDKIKTLDSHVGHG